MSEPLLTPIVLIILFIILTIISTFSKTDLTENFRKEQAQSSASEAQSIMRRIEKATKENVKFSKRTELELLCRQAGIPLKYYQFLVLKITCGIVLAIIALLVVRNEFLALEMIFIGQMLPRQFIVSRRNARVSKLEKQLGPFLQMVIKRYVSTKNFESALKLTQEEFKGLEPIYSELRLTSGEIETKIPITESLDNLAKRCQNKYLVRFADYYKIASSLGTNDARQNLLGQAYLQYEENRKLKEVLDRDLSEPIRDSKMLMATLPLFMAFGIFFLDGYFEFITTNLIGKLMIAVIVAIVMGILWFIENKVGAPLK